MWFVIIAIVLIIFILMYNQLVREGKQADNSFSTVNVLLKKRYDLIPNLVNTVKGYAMHEKEVFEKVTLLRDEAISQKSHDEIVKLDNGISSGIKDIFAVAEAYPELMASENFLALQKSLEKMEDELDKHMLNNIAVSLDLSIEDGKDGYERIMSELKIRSKYESERGERF